MQQIEENLRKLDALLLNIRARDTKKEDLFRFIYKMSRVDTEALEEEGNALECLRIINSSLERYFKE